MIWICLRTVLSVIKRINGKKIGKVQCPHINMPSISSNRDCRPPYCPLKEVSDNSVLEDIKVEMENLKDNRCFCHHYERGINECINVLNKHMESEKTE